MDITVIGSAEASLSPDRALLHVSVTHEGPDREEVVGRTTELARQVDAAVADLRQAEPSPVTASHLEPLQASSWRSQPMPYEGGPGSRDGGVETQHRASVAIRVEFGDVPALAEFGAVWGLVPGVNLDHVEWTLTRDRRRLLEDSTLVAAVSDARSRAAALAAATEAGELTIVEVADPGLLGGGGRPEMLPKDVAMGMASYSGGGALDLSPQDITVRTQVHVRFRSAG